MVFHTHNKNQELSPCGEKVTAWKISSKNGDPVPRKFIRETTDVLDVVFQVFFGGKDGFNVWIPVLKEKQTSERKALTKRVPGYPIPGSIHGTGIFTYIYHKNQPNV